MPKNCGNPLLLFHVIDPANHHLLLCMIDPNIKNILPGYDVPYFPASCINGPKIRNQERI